MQAYKHIEYTTLPERANAENHSVTRLVNKHVHRGRKWPYTDGSPMLAVAPSGDLPKIVSFKVPLDYAMSL